MAKLGSVAHFHARKTKNDNNDQRISIQIQIFDQNCFWHAILNYDPFLGSPTNANPWECVLLVKKWPNLTFLVRIPVLTPIQSEIGRQNCCLSSPDRVMARFWVTWHCEHVGACV